MTYAITLINAADGSVHGHRAGCADVAREARKAFAGDPWTFTVATKHEAWMSYNGDFLDECGGWCGAGRHDIGDCDSAWPIDWKPCANAVPAI